MCCPQQRVCAGLHWPLCHHWPPTAHGALAAPATFAPPLLAMLPFATPACAAPRHGCAHVPCAPHTTTFLAKGRLGLAEHVGAASWVLARPTKAMHPLVGSPHTTLATMLVWGAPQSHEGFMLNP